MKHLALALTVLTSAGNPVWGQSSGNQDGEEKYRLSPAPKKPAPAQSADEDRTLAIQRKLDTMKIDLAFENAKLKDVLAFIRDFSGLNIILDAAVSDKVDPDRLVTIRVKDLVLKDVLKTLLSPYALDYKITQEGVGLIALPGRGHFDALPPARSPMHSGKITAVATEIGLVVISIGKDDGVIEGDTFTVYRSGSGAYVAQIVIDRSDRKWSAGKVVLKSADPRVADDVAKDRSKELMPDAVPPHAPGSPRLSRASADEVKALRKELDEIRNQVRALSDQLLPAWSKYGIAADEMPEDLRGYLGIDRGLFIRRVRDGAAGDKAGLKPYDALPGFTEAQLLEALEKGAPLKILRQGKERTLGGR